MDTHPAKDSLQGRKLYQFIKPHQIGAALVETVVIMPILLLLALGAIQWSLIYEAKATVNYAAFMAARAGAVDHANSTSIRKGLAKGMIPLFSPDKDVKGLAKTYAKALIDVNTFSNVKILNPTKEAFQDFGVTPKNSSVKEIPNRSLHVQSDNIGSASSVNLQDANLLKLEITYGYKLKVPFIGSVISTVTKWFTTDPIKLAMLADNRIPILATATVRMQSEARDNSLVQSRKEVDDALKSSEKVTLAKGSEEDHRPWQSGPTGDGYDIPDLPPAGAGTPNDDSGDTGGGDGDDTGSGDDKPGAGNGSTDCNSTTVASADSSIAGTNVGNPINVVTGNKYQQETDLRPLPGKLGLQFIRHYNSQVSGHGVMGYGWSHSYDVAFVRINKKELVLRQSDGRIIYFTKDKNQYIAQMASDGFINKVDAGYDWQWPAGRTFQFTEAGLLERITETDGSSLQLHYSADDRLYKVVDPQKRQLSFKYTQSGRLQYVIDPAGYKTQYTYDHVGNLLQVTYPDSTKRRYHYEDKNDRHNLTGITDGRRIRYTTYGYDEKDRAILSTHADDVQKVTLSFEQDKTLVTNSMGIVSTYHTQIKDGIPLVSQIDGPSCSSCGTGDFQYTYNEKIQLTELISKNGVRTLYDYDEQGRTTQVRKQYSNGEEQLIARYAYTNDHFLPVRISRPSLNPNGAHTIDLHYTEQGQPNIITERGFRPTSDGGFAPIERITRLRYQATNVVAIDGPRDDVEDIIRLTYDDEHKLKTLTGPDGQTQTVKDYDHYNRPTWIQSGTQLPIKLTYSTRGEITTITQGYRKVIYDYDEAGNLIKLTGPDGDALRLSYDNAGRATELTSPEGRRAKTELDSEGRLTQRRLSNTQGDVLTTVSYLYDAQGRLQSQQQNGIQEREYAYDDNDRLSRISDAQGHATELQYNSLGQLLNLTQPGAGITAFKYDTTQQLSGITDARDNTTQSIKDDFGREVQKISPDTGATNFSYDNAGNLTRKIDAEQQISNYAYDAANRLIEQRDNDGTTALRYEVNSSRVASIQGPNTTETFQYNREGQLINHTRHLDGHTFTTGYTYNASGKLAEKILPDEQHLNYHYYQDGPAKGMLRAITRKDLFGIIQTTLVGEIDQLKHDGNTSLTYGNGLRTEVHYDKIGRPQTIQTEQALQLTYSYDEKGQIQGIAYNGSLNYYQYDSLDRLTLADTTLGQYQYQYDIMGNRTQKQYTSAEGETTNEAYTYPDRGNGNRLISIQSSKKDQNEQSYVYNVAGSPKQSGQSSYEYDANQRPTKVYRNIQLIAEYRYNRFGERIKKVVYKQGKKPKVTYYLYDGHTLTAEADANGNITVQYLYLNEHQPVVNLEGRSIYSIHTDHLGTPRIATDEDRQIVWNADYSPFGKASIKTEYITLNLRFPGQYEDTETGTYYNYFRDYNPNTGRYQTSDPIGLKGGINTYAYVGGNPLTKIDPFGLKVYMAETPVGPFGLGGHLYIIIEPDNINELKTLGYDSLPLDKNNRFTLRAGPDANFAKSYKGKLIKSVNGDSTTNYRSISQISSPNYGVCFIDGRSYDAQFIIDLLAAYRNYDDSLNYHGTAAEYDIPFTDAEGIIEPGKEYYNSNSFAVGLLKAAGVSSVPDPWLIQPGIDKPIPLDSTYVTRN